MKSPVTHAMAEAAVGCVDGYIRHLLGGSLTSRRDFFLVVGLRSTGQKLAMSSYGIQREWEHPYDRIAHGKFDISVRTGMPSREVQMLHPELLVEGDVIYGGSAVLGDIVVAGSGVQAYFDEAICFTTAWTLHALVENMVENRRQAADPSHPYYSF